MIQRLLDEGISYKFRANNASLHEISPFTHISIERHKGFLCEGNIFLFFPAAFPHFPLNSRTPTIQKNVPSALPSFKRSRNRIEE
jgi:hypothetical protein